MQGCVSTIFLHACFVAVGVLWHFSQRALSLPHPRWWVRLPFSKVLRASSALARFSVIGVSVHKFAEYGFVFFPAPVV